MCSLAHPQDSDTLPPARLQKGWDVPVQRRSVLRGTTTELCQCCRYWAALLEGWLWVQLSVWAEMNGRRDKSSIYCLCIWATGIKELGGLLLTWLHCHPGFLQSHFHMSGGSEHSYTMGFVSLFLSENKGTGLCCFRMQMYYSHQILLSSQKVEFTAGHYSGFMPW